MRKIFPFAIRDTKKALSQFKVNIHTFSVTLGWNMDLFNLQKIHHIHDPEANFIFLMFVSGQAEPAKCSCLSLRPSIIRMNYAIYATSHKTKTQKH